MAVNWYKTEQKFYGMTAEAENNVEEVEFESGKKRYIRKNSSVKRTFSFSFILDDKADEISFWTWYDGTLCCRSVTLYLTDLVTHSGTTEYRMTAEPQIQDSQYPKEVQISVIEE